MYTAHKEDPVKVLLAAAVGFAAGVLLAPRSGEETRDQLRAQADEAKSRVRLAADDLKTHAREGKKQVRDAASNVKKRGSELKDDLKSDVKKEDKSQ
jgi:gas vesicle protein